MTSRPFSVGSFFTSRSRLRSNVRAVASSRSTSSLVTSLIEMKCRFGGGAGGRRSSRMTRMSAIVRSLLWRWYEQNLVDLVHLDELHLDALVARGREVLADVVGANRQLAVAAVDEDGELDALGAPVVEQGLDRSADRPSGVEHVVDENDRLALERKVEGRRPHDGLRVPRRIAAAHLHVVSVEGDVDGAQGRRVTGALFDEASEALRERNTARLDADERDARQIRIRLDDLVRDAGKRAAQTFRVQQDLLRRNGRRHVHSTPFRPHWTGLKGFGRAGL